MRGVGEHPHRGFETVTIVYQGEVEQLWVNLPAKDKMTAPGYQTLLSREIPEVELPDGAGTVLVIAGKHRDVKGPARTFSPIDVWDLRLKQGRSAHFDFAEGRTLALVVLHGTVQVNGSQRAGEGQWVHLAREGTGLDLEAEDDATVLLLSGEPLNEPVVGHGPFVMNTQKEISEAIEDFNKGRFGRLPD